MAIYIQIMSSFHFSFRLLVFFVHVYPFLLLQWSVRWLQKCEFRGERKKESKRFDWMNIEWKDSSIFEPETLQSLSKSKRKTSATQMYF